MGRDEALVSVRGLVSPIQARRLRYFEEAMFDGLWDRWRDRRSLAAALMLEQRELRIEEKPRRNGYRG